MHTQMQMQMHRLEPLFCSPERKNIEQIVPLFFKHFVANRTQEPVMELVLGEEGDAENIDGLEYEDVYESDWLKGVTANHVALKAVWKYLKENSAALKDMENMEYKLN